KIQKHQKADGTFDGNTAWAPVFSQGLAGKALNRARQQGATVDEKALARFADGAVAAIDIAGGSFRVGGGGVGRGARLGIATRGVAGPASASMPGDAGVSLYSVSNHTAALQQAANTNKEQERVAREILARKDASKEEKDKAQATLDRVTRVEQ